MIVRLMKAFARRSADGTTIFTTSSSNRVCAYVLPSDILEPRGEPASLQAQGTLSFPEATNVIAPCPYFSLEVPETQVLLTALQDHPIHLHQAFPPTAEEEVASGSLSAPRQPPPLAHYNLIKSTTEQYLPVRSLIWPSAGTHFIAGTNDLVAVFDVNRTEPLLPIKTIPSRRHKSAGQGIGMRGTVAALAAHPSRDTSTSLIAAGTWTRHIALYDLMRGGESVATWSVKDAAPDLGGDGIVQTGWSPCGTYLLVNERQSDGILVYDLRSTKQLLATLSGRDGRTFQRLTYDVYPGTADKGGFEVWAGTKTGTVKVWEGVGNQEGDTGSSWEWEAHGSAVGSTALHSCGSVIATCSGEWKVSDPCESDMADGPDSEENSDSGEESESSASSGTSESEFESDHSGFITRQRIKPRTVVEETSLRIWSIGSAAAVGEPEHFVPYVE